MLIVNGIPQTNSQLSVIDTNVDQIETAVITEVADIKTETDKIAAEIIKTTAIKAVTDVLPDAGAFTTMQDDINDLKAHVASGARWMGSTAGSSPALSTSLVPWVLTSSATGSVFGTAVELFSGAEDYDYPITPEHFHPHKVFITDASVDDYLWKLRFANSNYINGEHTYANMAAAVAAKKYTDVVMQIDNTKTPTTSLDFHSGLATVGSKLWCQVMETAGDEGTISFIIGVHVH